MEYKTAQSEELLKALERAGRTPSLDLIRACLERQEELTPGLLEMFEESLWDEWDDEDDPRWYRGIHAGYLLIAYRETKALPLFESIYRGEWTEDLIEWFETEPSYYGPPAVPTFTRVLHYKPPAEDYDVSPDFDYGRSMSAEILNQIALQFPATRDDVVAALRAVLPPLTAEGEPDWPADAPPLHIWSPVVHYLGQQRDRESEERVMALFDRDWIDTDFITRYGFRAAVRAGGPPPESSIHHFDIIKLYEWFHRAEEKKSAPEPEPEPERQTRPASNGEAIPEVGRNDPCPCGSGRKYKYCHGRPGR